MRSYETTLSDKVRNLLHLPRKDYNKDADRLRPEVFKGDYSLVNIVEVGEASISTPDKPILLTYALGPCVALAGYDAKQKIGFLSHNCVGNVNTLHDLVLKEINKQTTEEIHMQIYIVGGMRGSYETVSNLRNYAKQKLNPTAINEDLALKVGDFTYLGKSFVLDTRNGKIYSVSGEKLPEIPSTNPKISLRV